jgi:diguanylate cyclase (GGDEF)-like protein/PAS domain S-box-containing protein
VKLLSLLKNNYQLLLKNLPDAFADHQLLPYTQNKPADCALLDVNPAFEKLTGLKKKNIIGKKVTELAPVAGLYPPDLMLLFCQAASTGKTLRVKRYIKPFNSHYEIIAYGKGNQRFAVIFHNTSSQKKLGRLPKRLNLTAREKYLNVILSNTPALVFSYKYIGRKRKYSYINQNIYHLLGFQPQEIIADPDLWISRIHPDDINRVRAIPEKLKKEELVQVEYRFNCKKNLCHWLHEKHRNVTLGGGKNEIVAVGWDITRRKHAKQLIEARANLLSYSQDHTLEEIMQKALDEIGVVVNSPLGFFHFLSGDKKTLTLKAWSTATLETFCNMGSKQGMQYDTAAAGVWVECLHKCQPVVHNDYASLPHRKGLPPGHAKITRELVVPIMRQNEIVAVLGVGNKPVDYVEEDVDAVSYLADVAYSIVLHKQSAERIRRLSYHDGLTGLYNRTFLEEEMKRLDIARKSPLSLVLADLNSLKLVNDIFGHKTGDELIKTAARVLKDSCRKKDILGRWGGDEFVILLPFTTAEDAKKLCNRIKHNCQNVHIKNIPLSIAFGLAARENINTSIEEMLQEADTLMYKHKFFESKNVRNAIVESLLKALWKKSFETEEHTRRMLAVGLKFGKTLKLPDVELSRLELLIKLHDIGKINISRGILTKKGTLTAQEWKIIKKHPETGFKIARSTKEFAHIAEDILAHHEHWDGTGYPQGLKGEEIPFLARVLAIIDAHDVMVNGRPYKEKLQLAQSAQEIMQCAGTQFDPTLAKVFVKQVLKM